jgi:putative peptidoglycan lipid II flippase
VLSAVLAEPIVRVLYERGEFGADETPVVAAALAAFALGLAFNGMMLMLNRGFFGLQAPWTPTVVALGNLLLNVGLYAVFYRVGTWGIPLSISLANLAGTAALLFLLRRRLGRIGLAEISRSFVRVLAASVLLGAAAFGIWHALDAVLGDAFWAQLVSLATALAAGAVVYVAACRALGVAEIRALHSLRGRFRKA